VGGSEDATTSVTVTATAAAFHMPSTNHNKGTCSNKITNIKQPTDEQEYFFHAMPKLIQSINQNRIF